MQLYFNDWLFQKNEDKLFAANEFLQYLNQGKLNESIDGFELHVTLIPRKTFQD